MITITIALQEDAEGVEPIVTRAGEGTAAELWLAAEIERRLASFLANTEVPRQLKALSGT